MSVPVKACAWHYGNSFTKNVCLRLSACAFFYNFYYPSLTKIFHISCGCMCETQNTKQFSISERKIEFFLPHNSVCIGTSKLSAVELVNTRSSSIFLHFFTDIFSKFFLFYIFWLSKSSQLPQKYWE